MTSPAPLVYDTYYHIYNRGNNRENIFIQERNYTYFMKLYEKYIEPIAETFAYCLMRNHFHLVVRIRAREEVFSKAGGASINPGKRSLEAYLEAYPSRRFSDFFNAYAKAINKTYGRTGSLFQHPFGRTAISTERQFWNVIAYVHQNPQKHDFVSDFRDWKWSSYGIMLTEKPTYFAREAVLGWFGGILGYIDLHEQWVSDVDASGLRRMIRS